MASWFTAASVLHGSCIARANKMKSGKVRSVAAVTQRAVAVEAV
jgi:hypothetical protein